MRTLGAIVANEALILRRDPLWLGIFSTMPILLMGFLGNAFGEVLQAEGYTDASGAEQAVPGMAVMFSLFLLANVAHAFFREHLWGTWDRTRSSWISTPQLVVGKSVVPFASALLQQSLLLLAGVVLFDLRVAGSVAAIAIVVAALAVSLVCLGLAVLAVSRTLTQLSAITNLSAVLLAGFGGAITPVSTLPDWARAAARATPSFWAMDGYREQILEPSGLPAVWDNVAALLAISSACLALAWRHLDFAQPRTA